MDFIRTILQSLGRRSEAGRSASPLESSAAPDIELREALVNRQISELRRRIDPALHADLMLLDSLAITNRPILTEIDPVETTDHLLLSLKETLAEHRCDVTFRFTKALPRCLKTDLSQLHDSWLTLIETVLQQPLEQAELTLDFADDQLHLSLQDKTIYVEAIATDTETSAVSSNVLVVADPGPKRDQLCLRLQRLGFDVATDPHAISENVIVSACVILQPLAASRRVIVGQLAKQTPLIPVSEPITQQQLKEALADTEQQSSQVHNNGRVLIVDDMPAGPTLLKQQLDSMGLSAVIAEDGEAAINAVSSTTFSLVFMDLQMPGMDGITATRRILEVQPSQRVIGLTAHASIQEKNRCREAGMHDVVIKPVRLNTLNRLLNSTARPTRAAATDSPPPVFDESLSLENANQRPEIALEMFQVLLSSLPEDCDRIRRSTDEAELKQAVHRLNGAVRFCGVPRLHRAVSGLESAVKEQPEMIEPMKHLLHAEVKALQDWAAVNRDVFTVRWLRRRPSHSSAHPKD